MLCCYSVRRGELYLSSIHNFWNGQKKSIASCNSTFL